MKRILIAAVVILGFVANVSAQDPNFSQFFASPLTLNPAMTGKFDGVYRLAANFRNQWPTINNAFQTKTLSFDMGIMKDRLPDFDQFGIGIMGFTDQAGSGVLTNNYAALSLAYHKSLDENGYNQLGVGFQGVYSSKRLDPGKVYFEDQLTANGFTAPTSEVFIADRLNLGYFDLNAGLFYNGTTDGFNNFYFGASMYHIIRPEESHIEENPDISFYLPGRVTLQAGGKIPMGEYNAIHFSANYSTQAKANNTVFGGAYMMNLNGNTDLPTNLYLGTWVRLNDAIIPYIGLEFGEFHFGATYDINTSSLKPGSNMRGGAEFSLIYIRQPADPNAKKLNCPKF